MTSQASVDESVASRGLPLFQTPSESSYRTGSTRWSGASMERVETLISETRTALESQVQTLTQRVTEMSVSAPRATAGGS